MSVADELIKLKKLMDEGLISRAEFDAEKAKILEASTEDARTSTGEDADGSLDTGENPSVNQDWLIYAPIVLLITCCCPAAFVADSILQAIGEQVGLSAFGVLCVLAVVFSPIMLILKIIEWSRENSG